jgi:hypothetical protein
MSHRAVPVLTLAQCAKDPALLVSAHRAHGGTLFFLGEFTQARIHLEQSIALYDPQQHHAIALCQRYPETAIKRSG